MGVREPLRDGGVMLTPGQPHLASPFTEVGISLVPFRRSHHISHGQRPTGRGRGQSRPVLPGIREHRVRVLNFPPIEALLKGQGKTDETKRRGDGFGFEGG